MVTREDLQAMLDDVDPKFKGLRINGPDPVAVALYVSTPDRHLATVNFGSDIEGALKAGRLALKLFDELDSGDDMFITFDFTQKISIYGKAIQ